MHVMSYPCGADKSDTELMKELVAGNSQAMETIYQRYAVSLRTVILSVLHEDADVDDVLHEVFFQLWKNADRYLPEKGLQGFLVTLARRRALDRVRRKLAYRRATDRFETHLKAELHNRTRSAFHKYTNIDLPDLMKRLIQQLPEAQQEVVHLTFYEGLSQREIASQKSLALGTVKTRLQLAQKKLLNQLTAVHEGKP
ncbi:MAG: sigma-70 family RNA polymerase sigma factor [Verrucomicrobia bacterium]|nr:sigma-70 family RNA polymerase sigma factor [Verrucomicrobiota bacterium]